MLLFLLLLLLFSFLLWWGRFSLLATDCRERSLHHTRKITAKLCRSGRTGFNEPWVDDGRTRSVFRDAAESGSMVVPNAFFFLLARSTKVRRFQFSRYPCRTLASMSTSAHCHCCCCCCCCGAVGARRRRRCLWLLVVLLTWLRQTDGGPVLENCVCDQLQAPFILQ